MKPSAPTRGDRLRALLPCLIVALAAPAAARPDGPISAAERKLLGRVARAGARCSADPLAQALVVRTVLNRAALIEGGVHPSTYLADGRGIDAVVDAARQYPRPAAVSDRDADAAVALALDTAALRARLLATGRSEAATGRLLTATGFRPADAARDPSQEFARQPLGGLVFNGDRVSVERDVEALFAARFEPSPAPVARRGLCRALNEAGGEAGPAPTDPLPASAPRAPAPPREEGRPRGDAPRQRGASAAPEGRSAADELPARERRGGDPGEGEAAAEAEDSGDGDPLLAGASASRADAYRRGRRLGRIRVVTIDRKPVALAAARAFLRMRAAGERDGVRLRVVSGFRSMSQQRSLYQRFRSGRGNRAAPPGYSNHQSGLALDLNTSAPGVYAWLSRRAGEFGFVRTVPSEKWHWELSR